MRDSETDLCFVNFLRTVSLLLVILCAESGKGEPTGLSDRAESYYETAVSILSKELEIVEKDGRKFRVLLQEIESEKVLPKFLNRRATGFFIFHKGDYYFVTAQHVAKIINPASRISFVNSQDASRQFVVAKLVGEEENFIWRHHEKSDVSVLKLFLPKNGVEEVSDLAIRSEDLDLIAPPRMSKLVVAGFPGGLGTKGGKISPITSVVHLASDEIHLGVKLEGIVLETAYLVNPPAGKGYSGAPVFYSNPEGKVMCIGILNGAWSDPTGGKFSLVSPSRSILELLDQKE